MKVKLEKSEWTLREKVGSGSFGHVFKADNGLTNAALKFIRKTPGAQRELLFKDRIAASRNVVPIIDIGEDKDHWIIAMPLASHSLRDQMVEGPLDLSEIRRVLEDLADALTDLQTNGVVHRDLKPENVLWLNGAWCIADFGISRYAEAATASGTHKFSWTPEYAAPEQWRQEHATPAADMYAFGIMAYEILVGQRPFNGSNEDLRQAHLHSPVPPSNGPKKLAWLIEDCLAKAPGYRPSPVDFRKRLALSLSETSSPGLAALQAANQANSQKIAEHARRESEAKTEEERRSALADAGTAAFLRLSSTFLEVLTENAPGALLSEGRNGAWTLVLNNAELKLTAPSLSAGWDKLYAPSFDVILHAEIRLTSRKTVNGYAGRAHSLWFGDIDQDNEYRWFETAFINFVMMGNQLSTTPYSLPPGGRSAGALWGSMNECQHAWPMTKVDPFDLSELVERWAHWLASSAEGKLLFPSHLPERSPGQIRSK